MQEAFLVVDTLTPPRPNKAADDERRRQQLLTPVIVIRPEEELKARKLLSTPKKVSMVDIATSPAHGGK